jgi:hypothetical protein
MADTQVLGTCVFGRAGSSPASRTRFSSNSLHSVQRFSRISLKVYISGVGAIINYDQRGDRHADTDRVQVRIRAIEGGAIQEI